jgi:hypothetical protein
MSKRNPGAHARQAKLTAQGRLADVDVDVVGILDVDFAEQMPAVRGPLEAVSRSTAEPGSRT